MLKPAQEMNQVAHEASVRAMEWERQAEEKQAREDAERDRNHAEFERTALQQAKSGHRFVVVTGLRLSRSRLTEQGFEFVELTRRESYETCLSVGIRDLEKEITELAQQTMPTCPEVPVVDGDTFVHRNPLISLLNTLQDREPAVPWADVEFFKQQLHFSTTQGVQWLEANARTIQSFLQLADRLRLARTKLDSVRWDNQNIPPGHDVALYVAWGHAGLDALWETRFSARYLRWVAESWGSMMALLSDEIEHRSAQGFFDAKFRLFFEGRGWFANRFDEDDGFDGFGSSYGPPSFWISELEQLGYHASIKQVLGDIGDVQAELRAVDPERLDKPVVEDCYQLEVSWQ